MDKCRARLTWASDIEPEPMPARPPVPSGKRKLRARCDECQRSIKGREGVVHLSYYEINRSEREKLWLRDDPPHWAVHCNQCNPHREEYEPGRWHWCDGCYSIWVGQIIREGLKVWDKHIRAKVWARYTDWNDFVALSAGGIMHGWDAKGHETRPGYGATPAGELVTAGHCTPSCLLATYQKLDDCSCRCRGDYHGVLASVEVDPLDRT